jgi:glyoxylase-like metal-dependent hydrolase (beta-lactamase superfamily II)
VRSYIALWVASALVTPCQSTGTDPGVTGTDIHKHRAAVPAVMIRDLAAGRQGFTSNVFLVAGDRTVLVDVGNGFDVVGRVRDHVDNLDAVVLTHTHPDHVGELDAVVSAFGVDVWGFDDSIGGVDHAIADGETVQLGDHGYEALHTPGHKNDHLCLYSPASGVLFAGDLVFSNGGFGRTDLEEGDRDLLVESIRRVLETIDEDLEAMHTGHGPSVTTDPCQDVELALQAARMRA